MNKFERTQQWASGDAIAEFLDEYFAARGWNIKRTTYREERLLCLGDRRFQREDDVAFVEYKSGLQTAHTNNIFLETVSVDTAQKPGWVYTCHAHFIVYAAVLNQKLLIFLPETLRNNIEALKAKFPTVKTGKGQNATYCTHGVIVPLAYAEAYLAAKTFTLDEVPEQWRSMVK